MKRSKLWSKEASLRYGHTNKVSHTSSSFIISRTLSKSALNLESFCVPCNGWEDIFSPALHTKFFTQLSLSRPLSLETYFINLFTHWICLLTAIPSRSTAVRYSLADIQPQNECVSVPTGVHSTSSRYRPGSILFLWKRQWWRRSRNQIQWETQHAFQE